MWTTGSFPSGDLSGKIAAADIPKQGLRPVAKPKVFSMQSKSGGTDKLDVPFNIAQKNMLHWLYSTFSDLSIPINRIITDLTMNGCVLSVDIGGKKLEISDKDNIGKEYYTTELVPTVDKILLELLLYGFTCVRKLIPQRRVRIKQENEAASSYSGATLKPSEENLAAFFDIENLPKLVVQPKDDVMPVIIWGKLNAKIYTLKATTTTDGYSMGDDVIDGEVLVSNAIEDDGSLSSKPSQILNDIVMAEKLWRYYMAATFNSAHPTWPIETNATGALTSKELSDAVTAPSILQNANAMLSKAEASSAVYVKHHVDETEAFMQRAAMLNLQTDAAKQPSPYASYDANLPAQLTSGYSAIESDSPNNHRFLLPPGMKVTKGPESKSPVQHKEIADMLHNKISLAIGVPTGIGSISKGGKFAENASMNLSVYRATLQSARIKCQTLIEGVFTRMFREWNKENPFEAVTVSFRFNYNPMSNLNELSTLWKEGIIKDDSYQEFAALTMNIPEEHLEKDFSAARAKRNSPEANGKASSSSSSSVFDSSSSAYDSKRPRTQ